MISKASAQTLNRWHNFMSVLAGFLVVAGIGGAFAPIWDPDRKLKKDWLVTLRNPSARFFDKRHEHGCVQGCAN